MMKANTVGHNVQREFRDVADLLRYVSSPTTMADLNRTSITNEQTFTQTTTLQEAVKLAVTGWNGGTQAIQKLRATILKALDGQLPRPVMRYKAVGPVLSIGRYLQGHPQMMMEKADIALTREAHRPKILTIVCNIAASQGLTTTPLLMRGAAIIVLCEVLAAHRIRCNVDLAFGVTHSIVNPNATHVEYTLRIKTAGEPVNISKLAFFLGHPSTVRRLMFAVMEHEPDNIRKVYGIGRDMGGYGLPSDVNEHGDVYIPPMRTSSDWSEDFAIYWLKQQLAKAGIALKKGV